MNIYILQKENYFSKIFFFSKTNVDNHLKCWDFNPILPPTSVQVDKLNTPLKIVILKY